MNVSGGRTLRQKLAVVPWGTALCVFATSGIALAVFQGLTLDRDRRARAIMEPYANLVSAATDAAVAFGDPVRAQEILERGARARDRVHREPAARCRRNAGVRHELRERSQ